VAKDTPKGTSFEEDHAADTRAILNTVSFDINDERKVTHLLELLLNKRVAQKTNPFAVTLSNRLKHPSTSSGRTGTHQSSPTVMIYTLLSPFQ
jgi:hypothetical protein